MAKKRQVKHLKARNRISLRSASLFMAVFVVIGGITIWQSLAAGSVTLSITPASGTQEINGIFTGTVNLNDQASVRATSVDVYMSFDPSILSVTSIAQSLPLDTDTFDNNAGTIHLKYTNAFGLPAGSYSMGSINFKAKGGGHAAVIFAPQTFVGYSQGASSINELTGTSGAMYTVSAPAPAPAPVPTPTPTPVQAPVSSGSTVKKTTQASTAPAPAAPTPIPTVSQCSPSSSTPPIAGVKTSDISYQSLTISWNINSSQPASFSYGTDKSSFSNTLTIDCSSPSAWINLSGLEAGTTYYYEIAAAGAKAYDGSFKTLGWPVLLGFVTQTNKPYSGAVTVAGQSYNTDKNGSLKLNLPAGDYTAAVKTAKEDYSFQFSVQNQTPEAGSPAQTQKFGFEVPAAANPLIRWGGLSAAGLAGLYILWMIISWTRNPEKRATRPAILKTPAVLTPPLAWAGGGLNTPAPVPPRPAPQTALPDPLPPLPPPPPAVPLPQGLNHAAEYPWIDDQSLTIQHDPKSSIAANGYEEPEDMYETGQKRLSAEGLQDPENPQQPPPQN